MAIFSQSTGLPAKIRNVGMLYRWGGHWGRWVRQSGHMLQQENQTNRKGPFFLGRPVCGQGGHWGRWVWQDGHMLQRVNKTNKGRPSWAMPHSDFILLIYMGSHDLLHGFQVYYICDRRQQSQLKWSYVGKSVWLTAKRSNPCYLIHKSFKSLYTNHTTDTD